MKVVVLAGGLSDERDVSLMSGSLIANALAKKGYNVALIDLSNDIEDEKLEELFSKEQKEYNFKIGAKEPKAYKNQNQIGKNVLEVCKMADKVFIALHGGIGENGKLQAVFDCMDIKYTGTGYEGSLIAMNKILTKKLLDYANIKTAKWMVYDNKKINELNYPLVVKPASNGSSIGISIVKDERELVEAIKICKKHDKEILIEEYIKGREFSVAILEERALMSIEIIPMAGFYDYNNKYQEGKTLEICPPNLEKEIIKKMQDIAIKVHNELKLGTYSRIDFILGKDNELYVLEANTLPGMTKTSLMPQEAKAEGMEFEDLCEKILLLDK